MTVHPCRYSPEIIAMLREVLLENYPDASQSIPRRPYVHDPFAGEGRRLAMIAQPEFSYSGTEIEPEFIQDPMIRVGDATDPSTYPRFPFVIVTSPAYPNGCSDSWAAKDGTKRITYRHRLAEMLGFDRELHVNNAGRYGYRGTGPNSKKRAEYWRIHDAAVANWDAAEMLLVNVSDFVYTKNGQEYVEPVVADWDSLLAEHGWLNRLQIPVGTQRNGYGENRDKRAANEVIIVAKKA